jgi:hypothetical protein
MQEPAALGKRQNAQGIGKIFCTTGNAFEWIDSNIYTNALAGPDILLQRQHRRAAPLADDHTAIEIDLIERALHRRDRCLIGAHFVALTPPARRSDCRLLGYADNLERQVLVHCRRHVFLTFSHRPILNHGKIRRIVPLYPD